MACSERLPVSACITGTLKKRLQMTEFKNYFSFSSSVENLLFKGLTVSSAGALVGLCLGVALFTFLYEAVKAFRHHLVTVLVSAKDDPDTSMAKNEIKTEASVFSWLNNMPKKTMRRIKFHCLQTALHMLQLTMGYMMMLIIMSYNSWLLITVILTNALCFYLHDVVLIHKPSVVPVEINTSSL